jgi:hypothetical protein
MRDQWVPWLLLMMLVVVDVVDVVGIVVDGIVGIGIGISPQEIGPQILSPMLLLLVMQPLQRPVHRSLLAGGPVEVIVMGGRHQILP